MMDRLTALPFFVVLMGLGALAMLVPAIHAVVLDDYVTMRVFFYGAVLFSILTLMIGLTTISYAPENVARSQLMALFASFTALPMMFAVPFAEAHNGVDYLDAWFEMVSCFTTTGATLYDDTGQLTPSLHVWRGMVGWMGGLLIWVTAVSIFAPMNLGGFEVRATGSTGRGAATHFGLGRGGDLSFLRFCLVTIGVFTRYRGRGARWLVARPRVQDGACFDRWQHGVAVRTPLFWRHRRGSEQHQSRIGRCLGDGLYRHVVPDHNRF